MLAIILRRVTGALVYPCRLMAGTDIIQVMWAINPTFFLKLLKSYFLVHKCVLHDCIILILVSDCPFPMVTLKGHVAELWYTLTCGLNCGISTTLED